MEINGVNSTLHLSPLKSAFGGGLCKILQLLDDGFEFGCCESVGSHLGIVAGGCAQVSEGFDDCVVCRASDDTRLDGGGQDNVGVAAFLVSDMGLETVDDFRHLGLVNDEIGEGLTGLAAAFLVRLWCWCRFRLGIRADLGEVGVGQVFQEHPLGVGHLLEQFIPDAVQGFYPVLDGRGVDGFLGSTFLIDVLLLLLDDAVDDVGRGVCPLLATVDDFVGGAGFGFDQAVEVVREEEVKAALGEG